MIYWFHPDHESLATPALQATVCLTGDVDMGDGAALHVLAQRAQTLTHLHVDVGAVRHFGACLLSWLLGLRRSMDSHGGRLTLGRPTSRLRSVLRLVGLQECFALSVAAGADRCGGPDTAHGELRRPLPVPA